MAAFKLLCPLKEYWTNPLRHGGWKYLTDSISCWNHCRRSIKWNNVQPHLGHKLTSHMIQKSALLEIHVVVKYIFSIFLYYWGNCSEWDMYVYMHMCTNIVFRTLLCIQTVFNFTVLHIYISGTTWVKILFNWIFSFVSPETIMFHYPSL